MAAIKGHNTKPELAIRHGLHRVGFRYKLHAADLPGKPDMVFPRYQAVIFINGCFWHKHDCHLFKWPQTRQDFWEKKILGNVANDARKKELLQANGWRIATVWECALKGKSRIPKEETIQLLAEWLQSDREAMEVQGERRDGFHLGPSGTDEVTRSNAVLCEKTGSKR